MFFKVEVRQSVDHVHKVCEKLFDHLVRVSGGICRIKIESGEKWIRLTFEALLNHQVADGVRGRDGERR